MSDKADKMVQALVTKPTFINNVLHMPGEIADVNLTELGIDNLGEGTIEDSDGKKVTVDLTPGLEPYKAGDGEPIEVVEVAAVAPHAPNPAMPQGIPPGTVQSGTGRLLNPATVDDEENIARQMVAPTDPKTRNLKDQEPKDAK